MAAGDRLEGGGRDERLRLMPFSLMGWMASAPGIRVPVAAVRSGRDEGGHPWARLPRSGSTSASGSSRCTAPTRPGRTSLQRKLRREEVLAFFAGLPPCLVGMEACATAHYWARELRALGHDVRLIPPAYVKPYVVAAEERCRGRGGDLRGGDAARRCAPRRSRAAEQQAARVVHRTHELLSRQRVTLINAIRGHMAEFGILAPPARSTWRG